MSATPSARDKSAPDAKLLESPQNPLLKRIRAIIRSGELLDEGQVLIETPRLIEDAIDSGIRLSTVILREPLSAAAKNLLPLLPQRVEQIRVPSPAFKSLYTTESSLGAVALAEAPHWMLDDLFAHPVPRLLVIAGVQDPGNLGSMLRAAEAFGLAGAILTRGTVSPWNSKAFRASAGSALRMPVVRNFSPAEVVELLNHHRVKLYAAVVRAGAPPATALQAGSLAIAVGAEAAGLPPEIERAAVPLSIPMVEGIDSLNVGAAAAILMYEAARAAAKQETRA